MEVACFGSLTSRGFGLTCILPFLSNPVYEKVAITILPIFVILIGIGLALIIASAIKSNANQPNGILNWRLSENSSLQDQFLKVDAYTPPAWERVVNVVITCMYFFYFSKVNLLLIFKLLLATLFLFGIVQRKKEAKSNTCKMYHG